MSKNTLLLVDGHALIHRGYHALPNLTNHKGEPTGAIFGFARLLLAALKTLKPHFVVVAFDSRGKTFRHKMYEDYKALRVRAPEDLYAQIPAVENLVRAMNIPIFKVPAFEADDIIATLAKQAEKKNLYTTILTGDMDLVQLVNSKTSVFAPKKGVSDPVVYTPSTVKEKYSFEPRQMLFFKSLRGDASDNIPGVPGVGEVTAKKIIQQFSTLEDLYKYLEAGNKIKNLGPSIHQKLLDNKEQAFLSRRLATIVDDVPVTLKKKDCVVHEYNRDEVVTLFADLGFRSLLKELPDAPNEAEDIQSLFQTVSKTPQKEKVEYKLDKQLEPVLREIEKKGALVDVEYLRHLNQKFKNELANFAIDIFKYSKEEFNINSTQQLAKVLFEKLKLPTKGLSRTKSGVSTNAENLAQLFDAHPIIKIIQEYREVAKLINTYTEPLVKAVQKDGRIHTSYNTDTATGRLSSKNPNLQQIPIRTSRGREIRKAFIAKVGHTLIAADYSQIELRVVAHLSKDPRLISAFRAGKDIHAATSKEMGVDRRVAKVINFSILYGKGPHGFARDLNIDIEEAAKYIDKYFATYSGLKKWIAETLRFVTNHGYAETMFGFRRDFPMLKGRKAKQYSSIGREAINMPVQGTAADILKRAMIAIAQQTQLKDTMILTVHDELVFEVPKAKAASLKKKIKQIMENSTTLDVPIKVEIDSNKNWGSLKK